MARDERPAPRRTPGRLRSAVAVLRGESVVPVQIVAEWIEYKVHFDDILMKLSAQLARQARSQKATLARQLQEAGPQERAAPATPMTTKAQLRRAYGISRIPPHLADKLGAPVPQNGEGYESGNQNE